MSWLFSPPDRGYTTQSVYLCTGYNGSVNITTHKKYAIDSWSAMTDIPAGLRAHAQGGTISGKGYLMSGVPNYTGGYSYDPFTGSGTWSANLTTCPDGDYFLRGGAINNISYIAGGNAYRKSNRSYTPATSAWASATASSEDLFRGGAFCIGQKLYCATNNAANSTSNLEWDGSTWTSRATCLQASMGQTLTDIRRTRGYQLGYNAGGATKGNEYIFNTWTAGPSCLTNGGHQDGGSASTYTRAFVMCGVLDDTSTVSNLVMSLTMSTFVSVANAFATNYTSGMSI